MEKVVLDTSVVVKWFVEEEGSEKAVDFLENYRQGKLKILAPEIIGLELANALFFGAGLRGKVLQEALAAFYNLGIALIPLDETLVREASKYSEKFKIATYDALFIVLAEKEKCALITADKKHHQKSFSRRIKYL
jgi:predicted nucleic acid-binding protein